MSIVLDDDELYQGSLLSEMDCKEIERLYESYGDDIFFGDDADERHRFASDIIVGRKHTKAQAKKIYEWLEETKVAIDTSHNHRVESVVFDYQWRALFKGIE